MELDKFLERVELAPLHIEFADTLAVIEAHYHYQPVVFTVGEQHNPAGENEGSCKIFAFAQLLGLSEAQTLALFGEHYRKDVLENPDGSNHANIRNFVRYGWSGVEFNEPPLVPKR